MAVFPFTIPMKSDMDNLGLYKHHNVNMILLYIQFQNFNSLPLKNKEILSQSPEGSISME